MSHIFHNDEPKSRGKVIFHAEIFNREDYEQVKQDLLMETLITNKIQTLQNIGGIKKAGFIPLIPQ